LTFSKILFIFELSKTGELEMKSYTKIFTWNGWTYYTTKTGKTMKNRHNPSCKNFTERVAVSSEEFTEVAKKYADIFGN
jgi:hypothetical protein